MQRGKDARGGITANGNTQLEAAELNTLNNLMLPLSTVSFISLCSVNRVDFAADQFAARTDGVRENDRTPLIFHTLMLLFFLLFGIGKVRELPKNTTS
ncbi:transmembrane protein, putative [Bodo saltans]|uniref:Transmembrane protein, putative n=1 Tax=Bodo saltans TaxID=75058 RepID=A0A0S4JTX0_BODSA|nr:transmembrane protein, putative [Bodo saltans]|eukprot:CUG93685.1 transmembrane protein, putative [Bodo saltans]